MSSGELAELKVVSVRIEELQERYWFAEKKGKCQRAQQLAQELLGAQAERKQLVDWIMSCVLGRTSSTRSPPLEE